MRKQSLDKTDIAIIGHLQVDGRRAYTTIAKDLGISEASVRQRVARLLRTNVIQIVAVSSPLDLGLIWAQMYLRPDQPQVERAAHGDDLDDVGSPQARDALAHAGLADAEVLGDRGVRPTAVHLQAADDGDVGLVQ